MQPAADRSDAAGVVMEYAAYAGLEPGTFNSGKMIGTRTPISKRGSPHLRHALYLSAFSVYSKHVYFHHL